MNETMTQTPSVPTHAAGQQRTKVDLSKLKPHPDNNLFLPPTEAEITNLADDIQRNGLMEPLEITNKGVVISGHSRLQALRILATSEPERFGKAAVVIRHDLTTDAQVKQRLLEANFNRRHLSLLQRLRVAQQMVLLARSEAKTQTGEVREDIGNLVGISGRQVDRLLRVLNLPPIIVEAVERKEITQGDAEILVDKGDPNEIQRIAGLPAGQIPRVVRLAVLHLNAELRPKKQKGKTNALAMLDRFLNQADQLQERLEFYEKEFEETAVLATKREARIRLAADVTQRLLTFLEQAKQNWENYLNHRPSSAVAPKKKLLKRQEA